MGQQFPDGPPPARDDEIRGDLGQWGEDEPSLVQARVRNRAAGLADHAIAVQEQVEVERPGPPSLLPNTGTPAGAFNREQGLEQVARGEFGRGQRGGVQVAALWDRTDRLGLDNRRGRQERGALEAAERFDRAGEMGVSIAEIGTQADGCDDHARAYKAGMENTGTSGGMRFPDPLCRSVSSALSALASLDRLEFPGPVVPHGLEAGA